MVTASTLSLCFEKVQTSLAQYATKKLSKDLDTTIHIEKVEITPLNSINLVGFYALDLEKDTIIKTKSLSILLKNINLDKNLIKIKKITLDNADIQLIKRVGERGFSFQFILDYFSAENKKKDNGKEPVITANSIELTNSRFRFKDYRAKSIYFGMDFTDLDAKNINLTFSDFKNKGSNTKLKIKHLSSLEKSDFNLRNLTGNLEMDSNFVLIDSLHIVTANSNLVTDYFRFDFQNPSQFEEDFEEKVKMTTYFRESKLNFKDIGYFTSFFEGIDRTAEISGKFEGTVADFKSKNLRIKLDNNTLFKGNLDMKGLPFTEKTTFKIKIDKFISNEKELANLDIPPFTEHKKLSLPKEIKGMGEVDITGLLVGKFNDFKGNLIAITSQGKIETEARYWERDKTTLLDGKVIVKNLNLGVFIDEDLGMMDANLDSKFSYNSETGIELSIKGELPQFSYKGYNYKSIKVDGDFIEKSFEGKASLKDNNGIVDFIGLINFESKIPKYDFKSEIKKLNLSKLKIVNDTLEHIVSATLWIKGEGSNIDNSNGNAIISNLEYLQNGELYTNKKIEISSQQFDSIKEIKLASDIADVNVKGQFLISELQKTLDIIGQKVVPALYTSIDTVSLEKQLFEFDLLLKNYSPINKLFTPAIQVASNTIATGDFSSENQIFNLTIESDSIQYLSNRLLHINASLKKPTDILNLKIEIENAHIGSDLSLDNMEITSLIKDDHIMPSIKWRSPNGESYGEIQGDGYWYSEDYFDFLFLPSYFHFKDRDWVIKEDATLIVDSSSFNFNGIEISNNFNEVFSVVGTISSNPEDVLKVYLDNFNLENINPFIGNSTTKYHGNINGSACISNVYEQIEIISDFYINVLKVNDELVGDIALNTDWINSKKGMHIKGELLRDKLNTFDFIGYYFPFEHNNSLDFKCILTNTDLAFLNPYVIDQGITRINGKAKGEVKVTGEPESPLLEGSVSLMRTGFNVDYLNTHYDFSGLMIIENNDIFTDNIIEIRDQENNLAYFNGAIYHENFKDFDFNVYIEIPKTVFVKGDKKELRTFEGAKKIENKFISLNTNVNLNTDFYGKIYATGDINIEGYQDEINIVVNAKTEKGSDFTLPLYGSSEIELEDYVVFINKDSTYNEEETIDLEGINLDINVEVTPETKLQLIFDEVYGDIITANGYGNLSMTVDKFDQFNLTGKYTIDEGDYLFTLGLKRFENLINKKFEIANGSTINWYGNPYNAGIDINAIYKLKASLYEIMPQLTEDVSQYKQRRDVNCVMRLTDNLMTPTIDFAIELPRANETERAVIANLMETKQEMNKQIFSLLLLNRFLPSANNTSNSDDGGRGNSGAVSTTASEILSNQLSNWLSKLSSDIDIGLNYRPGDNITSDEIAVALSTELLNNRLVISSNFGVSQGNEINQNENELIGDVNIEYKLNEDGTFRIRVFSRTNEYDITNANQTQTTSGVGLYYKKEFNNWKEFITLKKKLKQRDLK